jgi:hypothetical protein
VPGSWNTISVPDASFNADIMLLLTDGSVLIHNGYANNASLDHSKEWLRLYPSNGR